MNKRLFSLLLAFGISISLMGCSSGAMQDNVALVTEKTEDTKDDKRTERKVESYKSLEFENMVFQLPDYYGENTSNNKESLYYYAERGSKLVYLFISSGEGTDVKGEFSDFSKAVVSGWVESFMEGPEWKDYKEYDSKIYKTDSGMEASETNYYVRYADGDQEVPFDCVLTIIYDKDNKKLVITSLMQSKEADYEYRGEYRKMMKEVKSASAGDSSKD